MKWGIPMPRFLLFFLWVPVIWAQPADLTGPDLRDWLRQNFYAGFHQPLEYREARVAIYNLIDNQSGAVVCVYGGFEKAVPAGGNLSNPMPINCEHTIPQSFFNRSLPMRSDIHHLFPTYERWNSNRANFPFAEIPDHESAGWMIDDDFLVGQPDTNKDAFSEMETGRFEPPEAHKGNVARAVFYFYTMYPDYPLNRVGDLDLFMAWHVADPPDARERARNDGIAAVQGNRNPYVDHPRLAMLAWPNFDRREAETVLAQMNQLPGLLDRFADDLAIVIAEPPEEPEDPDPNDPPVVDHDDEDVDRQRKPAEMLLFDTDLITIGGRVGIGTRDPAAALDVHGEIYQRGTALHADFVFDADFELPAIADHAAQMWSVGHLPAVPPARTDHTGQDVLAVGAFRRGMLVELELAHRYIEQLHQRLEALEQQLAKQAQDTKRSADVIEDSAAKATPSPSDPLQ